MNDFLFYTTGDPYGVTIEEAPCYEAMREHLKEIIALCYGKETTDRAHDLEFELEELASYFDLSLPSENFAFQAKGEKE